MAKIMAASINGVSALAHRYVMDQYQRHRNENRIMAAAKSWRCVRSMAIAMAWRWRQHQRISGSKRKAWRIIMVAAWQRMLRAAGVRFTACRHVVSYRVLRLYADGRPVTVMRDACSYSSILFVRLRAILPTGITWLPCSVQNAPYACQELYYHYGTCICGVPPGTIPAILMWPTTTVTILLSGSVHDGLV